MVDSAIEWTDATWNPIVGCSRVSKGCEHCYAERVAHRGMSAQHRGLTVMGKHGPRWTGEVRFLPDRLAEPLSWRKPRRVFVNSMSDLFHEDVTVEQIAAVFGVMAATPQHTYQILTKRPERAQVWFRWLSGEVNDEFGPPLEFLLATEAMNHGVERVDPGASHPWPLPNVWFGVSVEDQATADARIPLLLDTPAAIRWVSYEPALGPVDFGRFMWPVCARWPGQYRSPEEARAAGAEVTMHRQALVSAHARFLNWIVIGGESGPGARPFDLAWARSTVEACRAASVPCFVKQLGAKPETRNGYEPDPPTYIRDRKGGDPSEWPEDLRVREWPERRP